MMARMRSTKAAGVSLFDCLVDGTVTTLSDFERERLFAGDRAPRRPRTRVPGDSLAAAVPVNIVRLVGAYASLDVWSDEASAVLRAEGTSAPAPSARGPPIDP